MLSGFRETRGITDLEGIIRGETDGKIEGQLHTQGRMKIPDLRRAGPDPSVYREESAPEVPKSHEEAVVPGVLLNKREGVGYPRAGKIVSVHTSGRISLLAGEKRILPDWPEVSDGVPAEVKTVKVARPVDEGTPGEGERKNIVWEKPGEVFRPADSDPVEVII